MIKIYVAVAAVVTIAVGFATALKSDEQQPAILVSTVVAGCVLALSAHRAWNLERRPLLAWGVVVGAGMTIATQSVLAVAALLPAGVALPFALAYALKKGGVSKCAASVLLGLMIGIIAAVFYILLVADPKQWPVFAN